MKRNTIKNKEGQYIPLIRRGETGAEIGRRIINLAGRIEDMEERLGVDFVETFSGCEISDIDVLQNLSSLAEAGSFLKDYPEATVLPAKIYVDRQEMDNGPQWAQSEVHSGWNFNDQWLIRGYHLDDEIYEAMYGPLGADDNQEDINISDELDKAMESTEKVILVITEHPVVDDRYGVTQELDPDFWSREYIQMIGTDSEYDIEAAGAVSEQSDLT